MATAPARRANWVAKGPWAWQLRGFGADITGKTPCWETSMSRDIDRPAVATRRRARKVMPGPAWTAMRGPHMCVDVLAARPCRPAGPVRQGNRAPPYYIYWRRWTATTDPGGRHAGKFSPPPTAQTAVLRHAACDLVRNLLNQRAAPRIPVRSQVEYEPQRRLAAAALKITGHGRSVGKRRVWAAGRHRAYLGSRRGQRGLGVRALRRAGRHMIAARSTRANSAEPELITVCRTGAERPPGRTRRRRAAAAGDVRVFDNRRLHHRRRRLPQ